MNVLKLILDQVANEKKGLAISADPGKSELDGLVRTSEIADAVGADYLVIVGSMLARQELIGYISEVKANCDLPVIFSPGNAMQIPGNADAMMMLSLISGRNPEMLIGSFVEAAPVIRSSGLEVIPAGHMLIESGKITSLMYLSNTLPIPFDKTGIAVCTAMAGEMLGLKLIYMDAGSGAISSVPMEMIRAVKQNISVPLVVGGGIRTPEDALEAWDAGADIVVVGSTHEIKPDVIFEIGEAKRSINN